MRHIGDGELLAHLDGELEPGRAQLVEEHLLHCPRCAAELEELRSASALFSEAVALLDSEFDRVGATRERVRAEPNNSLYQTVSRGFLKAAAIVLLFGGVALGALPGSPIRDWIGEFVGRGSGERISRELSTTPGEEELLHSEVSLIISTGEGIVELGDQGEAGGPLRVQLVGGNKLSIRWTGGGAVPHFSTGPGRVEVSGGTGGELLIEVPMGIRTQITLEGETILIAEDGALEPLIEAELEPTGALVFHSLDRGGER